MLNEREREALRADLSAYLDGELDEERTRAVEAWLAESDEARQLLDELRDVTDHLAHLPRHRAPDAVAAAMERQAELRLLLSDRDVTAGGKWRILKLGLGVSASAAVVLLCVFAGYVALQQTGEDLIKRSATARPAPTESPTSIPPSRELAQDANTAKRITKDSGNEVRVTTTPEPPITDHEQNRSALSRKGDEQAGPDFGVTAAARDAAEKATVTATDETPDGPALAGSGAIDAPMKPAARAAGRAKDTSASTLEAGQRPLRAVPELDPPLGDPGPPQVQVWVASRTVTEYFGNSLVLSEWAQEATQYDNRLEWPEESRGADAVAARRDRPLPGQAALARQYRIPARELSPRLRRLTKNVAEPGQVQVQMNLLGADVAALADAMRATDAESPAPDSRVAFSASVPRRRLATTPPSPTGGAARGAMKGSASERSATLLGLSLEGPALVIEDLTGLSVSPELTEVLARLLTGDGEVDDDVRRAPGKPTDAMQPEIDLRVVLLPPPAPPALPAMPGPATRPSATTQPMP